MPGIRVVNISDQKFWKMVDIKFYSACDTFLAIPATLPWQLWHWISEFPQMDDVRILQAALKRRMGLGRREAHQNNQVHSSAKMCQLPQDLQVPNVPRHNIATLATLLLRCLRSEGSHIQVDMVESGYAEIHSSHHPKRN